MYFCHPPNKSHDTPQASALVSAQPILMFAADSFITACAGILYLVHKNIVAQRTQRGLASLKAQHRLLSSGVPMH